MKSVNVTVMAASAVHAVIVAIARNARICAFLPKAHWYQTPWNVPSRRLSPS